MSLSALTSVAPMAFGTAVIPWHGLWFPLHLPLHSFSLPCYIPPGSISPSSQRSRVHSLLWAVVCSSACHPLYPLCFYLAHSSSSFSSHLDFELLFLREGFLSHNGHVCLSVGSTRALTSIGTVSLSCDLVHRMCLLHLAQCPTHSRCLINLYRWEYL